MKNRLPLIAAMLGSAAVAVVVVLLLTGGGSDDDNKSSQASKTAAALPAALKEGQELSGPNGSFKLRYPKTWERVTPDDLGLKEGTALAAIKRTEGDAFLSVQQRSGKLADTPDKIAADLTKRLTREIKDFKLVRADNVKIPAGNALSYTFVREKSGQVQNLVVVPEGDTTYTLNSVVAGKAEKAAEEIGQMVQTFDPAEK